MSEYNKVIQASSPVLHLTMDDQGQMFAGVATIRAAVLDVIDRGDEDDQPWMFYENTEHPLSTYDQSMADFDRSRFVDAVIKQIAKLQTLPHDGIRLQDLCSKHKRAMLPVPTAAICGMCEAEMKVFTFYWKDGKRDVLPGDTPSEALNRAGYGQGAVAALDFHCKGDNRQYEWKDRQWVSVD